MPTVICKNCGGTTNTAGFCENDFNNWGKFALKCFAKWDGKEWIKGCSEPKDKLTINWVRKILKNKNYQDSE